MDNLGYHGVEYDLVSPEWIIFPMEHPPIGAPIFSTSMFFCDVFVQRIQQKNAVFFWFLMYTGWCFGTMEFYDFPFSWDQLTDFHIFQRGRYTTNQVYFVDQTLEVVRHETPEFNPTHEETGHWKTCWGHVAFGCQSLVYNGIHTTLL